MFVIGGWHNIAGQAVGWPGVDTECKRRLFSGGGKRGGIMNRISSDMVLKNWPADIPGRCSAGHDSVDCDLSGIDGGGLWTCRLPHTAEFPVHIAVWLGCRGVGAPSIHALGQGLHRLAVGNRDGQLAVSRV